MFFCETCKTKNEWPGIIPMSHGPCEVCGKVSDCYDVPSSYLPLPKRTHELPKKQTAEERTRALIVKHLPKDRFLDTYTLTANVHGHRTWSDFRRRALADHRRKSPTPSKERLAKSLVAMRREGLVEYDPDSLGQVSRWKLK